MADIDTRGITSALNWFDVDAVKSDSVDLTVRPRWIMCNVAGTVKMTDWGGTALTLTLLAGVFYPVRPVRIWATGTSATGIIGLY